ncbi:hypothetical protein Cadr_000019939 [Camelus dromedarius]|uniref:Uncharacterized protein n=1 Tax=Camelus dromedarius TaxID=9838 RepID=A0A5N4D4Z1_CAMDR|nr:hypothetical protein Cadr_000019939 [Camelus dromedarius]
MTGNEVTDTQRDAHVGTRRRGPAREEPPCACIADFQPPELHRSEARVQKRLTDQQVNRQRTGEPQRGAKGSRRSTRPPSPSEAARRQPPRQRSEGGGPRSSPGSLKRQSACSAPASSRVQSPVPPPSRNQWGNLTTSPSEIRARSENPAADHTEQWHAESSPRNVRTGVCPPHSCSMPTEVRSSRGERPPSLAVKPLSDGRQCAQLPRAPAARPPRHPPSAGEFSDWFSHRLLEASLHAAGNLATPRSRRWANTCPFHMCRGVWASMDSPTGPNAKKGGWSRDLARRRGRTRQPPFSSTPAHPGPWNHSRFESDFLVLTERRMLPRAKKWLLTHRCVPQCPWEQGDRAKAGWSPGPGRAHFLLLQSCSWGPLLLTPHHSLPPRDPKTIPNSTGFKSFFSQNYTFLTDRLRMKPGACQPRSRHQVTVDSGGQGSQNVGFYAIPSLLQAGEFTEKPRPTAPSCKYRCAAQLLPSTRGHAAKQGHLQTPSCRSLMGRGHCPARPRPSFLEATPPGQGLQLQGTTLGDLAGKTGGERKVGPKAGTFPSPSGWRDRNDNREPWNRQLSHVNTLHNQETRGLPDSHQANEFLFHKHVLTSATTKAFAVDDGGARLAYSCLLIHICWKWTGEARMEPQSTRSTCAQRSDDLQRTRDVILVGGTVFPSKASRPKPQPPWNTLIFIVLGAVAVIPSASCRDAAGQHCVGVQVLRMFDWSRGCHTTPFLRDKALLRITRSSERHLALDSLTPPDHLPRKVGLEKRLWTPEALVACGDDLAVGQLVALLQGGAGGGGGHSLLELLLDVAHDLPLSRGGEALAALRENLHEVVRQSRMAWGGRSPRRWARVGDPVPESMTIPVVRPEAYRDRTAWMATLLNMIWRKQWAPQSRAGTQSHPMLTHHAGMPQMVTGYLGHLLTVWPWGSGGLGQQHRVLCSGPRAARCKRCGARSSHVRPSWDDAMLNGVLRVRMRACSGPLAHVAVLLPHAHHDALVSGTADDGREDSPGGVVPSKASFAHARTIVDDERSDFFFHRDLAGTAPAEARLPRARRPGSGITAWTKAGFFIRNALTPRSFRGGPAPPWTPPRQHSRRGPAGKHPSPAHGRPLFLAAARPGLRAQERAAKTCSLTGGGGGMRTSERRSGERTRSAGRLRRVRPTAASPPVFKRRGERARPGARAAQNMSIYGDLSERRAPIGPSGQGTWGPAPGPAPSRTAPNRPARVTPAHPRPPSRTPRGGRSPGVVAEAAPRPGTAARRGGGPGCCTPKLPGPGLGGTRSRVFPRCPALQGGLCFLSEALQRSRAVKAGSRPRAGGGEGRVGGGVLHRPPLRHFVPRAMTSPSPLSRWEGAARPPARPPPRRPFRRSWGALPGVPDGPETGPILPHPVYPARLTARPPLRVWGPPLIRWGRGGTSFHFNNLCAFADCPNSQLSLDFEGLTFSVYDLGKGPRLKWVCWPLAAWGCEFSRVPGRALFPMSLVLVTPATASALVMPRGNQHCPKRSSSGSGRVNVGARPRPQWGGPEQVSDGGEGARPGVPRSLQGHLVQVKQPPSSPADCRHADAKALPMATPATRPSWGARQGCCPSDVCPTHGEPGDGPPESPHFLAPLGTNTGLQPPGRLQHAGPKMSHAKWEVSSIQGLAPCVRPHHVPVRPPRLRGLPLLGLQLALALLCLVCPGYLGGQIGRGQRPLDLCPRPPCSFPHLARRWGHGRRVVGGRGRGLGVPRFPGLPLRAGAAGEGSGRSRSAGAGLGWGVLLLPRMCPPAGVGGVGQGSAAGVRVGDSGARRSHIWPFRRRRSPARRPGTPQPWSTLTGRAGGGSNGQGAPGALLALFSQGGRRLAGGTKGRRREAGRAGGGAARELRGGGAGRGLAAAPPPPDSLALGVQEARCTSSGWAREVEGVANVAQRSGGGGVGGAQLEAWRGWRGGDHPPGRHHPESGVSECCGSRGLAPGRARPPNSAQGIGGGGAEHRILRCDFSVLQLGSARPSPKVTLGLCAWKRRAAPSRAPCGRDVAAPGSGVLREALGRGTVSSCPSAQKQVCPFHLEDGDLGLRAMM